MDYERYGQYVFVKPEHLVYAEEAESWCKDHGLQVALFKEEQNFWNIVDQKIITASLINKFDYYWYVNGKKDGKYRHALLHPFGKQHILFDESNGKYPYDKFICMDQSSKGEQDPDWFTFQDGIVKVISKNQILPEVNTTNQGFPKFTTTSDVSKENGGDALPTGNGFSLSDLFSKGDFSLFVLLIVVASLFVVVVVLAIALSCVCKKYRKAKANNTTDASETV